MNVFRQRGELALSLSLLGVLISLIGIGVGTGMSQSVQQSSSRASGGVFTYKSTLEIRNEKGDVVPWEQGMTWTSNLKDSNIPEKSAGDVKMPNDQLARVVYDATGASGVPSAVQNFAATITVSVPTTYEIVESFCEDRKGETCVSVRTSTGNSARVIPNIRITNGAEIVYGIVVRKVESKQNTCRIKVPECAPKNVRFDQVSEHNVTVVWDKITDCAPYTYDNDRFWIDVVRQDGGVNKIVCATDSGDEEATCTLGKAVPAGREIDRDSSEFRTKKWDQHRTYSVNVYLHNKIDSCLSDPSGVSFSYASRPPEQPQNPAPTGVSVTPIAPSPAEEPSPTTAPSPTTPVTPKTPSGMGDVKIQVYYLGTYDEASKDTLQFYIETCDAVNGVAQNCGPASKKPSNQRTGKITLVKSTATKRYYGLPLKDVSAGEKVIVLRSLINDRENRSMKASAKQCESVAGEGYECLIKLVKGGQKEVRFDITIPEVKSNPSPVPPQKPGPTIPPKQDEKDFKIKHVSGNGPVRVVLIPSNFPSDEAFEKFALEHVIPAIRKTNIAQYEDMFTYLMLEDNKVDLGCSWSKLRGVKCDKDQTIKDIRSAAMSSAALVVQQEPTPNASEKLSMILGQNEWDVMKYNVDINNKTIYKLASFFYKFNSNAYIHEMGHGFGGLADEYVNPFLDESVLKLYNLDPTQAQNCSRIESGACKWGSSTGCFEGCTLQNYGRSTNDSIMNSKVVEKHIIQEDGSVLVEYETDPNFNPVSLAQMEKYFALMKNATFAIQSDAVYLNSLHLVLDQPQVDALEVKTLESKQLYADAARELSGPGYEITVENISGETLYKTAVAKYTLTTHSPEPIRLSQPDVYLPFFPEADHIRITSEDGKQVLRINLAEYGMLTAVEGASACGDTFCDARLGENENSCRVDCGAHLAQSELERADFNEDGVVNGFDLAMVIETDVYQVSADGDVNGDLETNALDYSTVLKWFGSEL